MKTSIALLALSIALLNAPLALALDPTSSSGIGGHGTSLISPGGRGVAPQGAGPLGHNVAIVGGMGVGATFFGGGSDVKKNDIDHPTGGISYLGGKTRSTMDNVPGRSPTYVHIAGGKDIARATMGGIGP
jgi:hypothetical protein